MKAFHIVLWVLLSIAILMCLYICLAKHCMICILSCGKWCRLKRKLLYKIYSHWGSKEKEQATSVQVMGVHYLISPIPVVPGKLTRMYYKEELENCLRRKQSESEETIMEV